MKKLITICLLAFVCYAQVQAQSSGGYIGYSQNAVSLRQVPHPANPSLTAVEIFWPGSSQPTNGSFTNSFGLYRPVVNGTPQLYAQCTSVGETPQWITFCGGCTLNDIPSDVFMVQLYSCGSVYCWSFDSTYPLKTNPCRGDNNFTTPGTWDYLRVPKLGTTGIQIWKDVYINDDVTITQSTTIAGGNSLYINSGKTLTLGRNNLTTDVGRFENYLNYVYEGGKLVNNGTIKGNISCHSTTLINNGVLAPGNIAAFPFRTAEIGKLVCSSSSVIDLKLNNTGNYPGDRFYIYDSVALNGTVKINFANGFTPQVGDRFSIIESEPIINGAFTNVQLPTGVTGFIDHSLNQSGAGLKHIELVITGVNVPLTISGSSNVCVGGSITLTANQSGGNWSSIAGRAVVFQGGVVVGTSGGTAKIKYTLGNTSVVKDIVVSILPNTPTFGIVAGTTGLTGFGGFCRNKSFTVVGKPSGGFWSSTGVFSITNLGLVTTANTSGSGTVTYSIADANGCINSRTASSNVTFLCKGINNQQLAVNNQFIIYPNPAHNVVNIKINKLIGAGSFVITDLYGKQLKTQRLSIGANTIDVSSFAKGMYLVTVITDQGKQTQKIVVE